MSNSTGCHIERRIAQRRARGRVSRDSLDEIRNCLAPILTSAVIARSMSVGRRQEAALDIIERQAARLARIISDVFDADLEPTRLD